MLTVPTVAMHTSGNQTVVQQMKNGAQVTTPVTVGTAYGATTQILSGLKAGDQVVVTVADRVARAPTGPADRLRRGSGTGGYPVPARQEAGQGGGFPGRRRATRAARAPGRAARRGRG